VARVCQSSFGDLDGAPVMVTPPSVPIPLAAELENAYLPSAADVIAAVHAARGEAR
jgi:pyruvate/2-oxoglutarate/acetoin dehydrogenase E1 component